MIPEGFRLGDGWECSCSPAGEPWECNAYLGHGEECKADAPYVHTLGRDGACDAHAVAMGALVAIAPVVEAPPLSGSAFSDPLEKELAELTMRYVKAGYGAASPTMAMASMLKDHVAALATAEQRADRAEDKLRRIGEVVKTSGCDCDCEHHRDECSDECQRCTGCLISSILRDGT